MSRVGAAALALSALLASAAAYSSLAASNSVPSTNLGESQRAIGPNDLKPAGCASLNLTSIVTGSGNFSINASNALVLGSSGDDNMNDNGHYNCLVGGAGLDHVNGHSDDICIIGPTPGAKYNGCVTAS